MESLRPVRSLIRSGWERTSDSYGKDQAQIFQRFAGRLVELIDWSPGQQVLDVGVGTGVVALLAAQRVGPSGRVVGVDFASGMITRAGIACGASQHPVFLAQMEAEALGFRQDSFDRIVCAFSLFQFVDMTDALREMHRVLKPGGMVGLSNWGPEFFTPVAAMQRDLFRQFQLRPLLPNPITFKPDQLRDMLLAEGFSEIQRTCDQVDLWFGSPEDIWDWNLAMGPLPIMLEHQLTPDQQQELKHRYLEMLEPLRTANGIQCTFHPLYALAFKSSG